MSKNREVRPVSMEEDVRLLWDSIPTGKRSIIANQILREELPKYLDGKMRPIDDLRKEIEKIVKEAIESSQELLDRNFDAIPAREELGVVKQIEKETKETVEKATDAVCSFIKKMSK